MATTKRRLGGMVLPDDMFPTQFRGPMPALPNPTQTGQPAFANVRGDKPMVSPQPVGPQAAGMRRPEQEPMPTVPARESLGSRIRGSIAERGLIGSLIRPIQSVAERLGRESVTAEDAARTAVSETLWGSQGRPVIPSLRRPDQPAEQPRTAPAAPAQPTTPPPARTWSPAALSSIPNYAPADLAVSVPGLPDRPRGYVNNPTAPITAEQAWALRDGAPTEITVPAFATDRRTGARLMPPTERSAPRVADASNRKEAAAAARAARDAMEARTNATAEAYRERFVASGNRGLRRGEPIGRPAWRQRQTEDLLRLQGRQDIAKQQEANKPSMQPTSVQQIGDTVVAYGADGKPVFQPASKAGTPIYDAEGNVVGMSGSGSLMRPQSNDRTTAALVAAAQTQLSDAMARRDAARAKAGRLTAGVAERDALAQAEAEVQAAQDNMNRVMGQTRGTAASPAASDPNTTPPTETPPPGAVQKRQLSDGTWQYTDKDGNIIPRR